MCVSLRLYEHEHEHEHWKQCLINFCRKKGGPNILTEIPHEFLLFLTREETIQRRSCLMALISEWVKYMARYTLKFTRLNIKSFDIQSQIHCAMFIDEN